MTPKQHKTLTYANFTEPQIAALAAVFQAFPPPERRKEIDGFVSRTVGNMNQLNEARTAKQLDAEARILARQEVLKSRLMKRQSLTDYTSRISPKPNPPTP